MSLIEIQIYENDRKVGTWGGRLPTDRPSFSDASGSFSAKKAVVDAALPKGCTWRSDWSVLLDRGRFDEDGWEYALDFPLTYFSEAYLTACVRRRVWRRVMLVSENPSTGEPIEPTFEPWFEKLIAIRGDEESFDALNEQSERMYALKDHIADNEKLDSMTSEEKVGDCTACSAPFTLIRRRHRCRACVRQFCHNCCDFRPDYGNVRVCSLCITKHIEDAAAKKQSILEDAAMKKEVKRIKYVNRKILLATSNHEANKRCLIKDAEDITWFEMQTEFERGMKELTELEDAELATFLSNLKAGELLDMWQSHEGPRNGLLTLCVVGASDLPTPGRAPATTMVKVVCGEKEHSSEYIPKTRDPSYNYNLKLNVEDDLSPIELLVYLYGGGDNILVAAGQLHLQSKETAAVLKRHVSAGTHVYYEEAFLQLPMVNLRKRVQEPNDTAMPLITVRYTFEVRENDKGSVGFCPECGRLHANCVCDDAVRLAREEKELMQRRQVIVKMHRANRVRRQRAQGIDINSKVREWEAAAKELIFEAAEGTVHILESERAEYLQLRESNVELLEVHSNTLNREGAASLVIRGLRHAKEQQYNFLPTMHEKEDGDGALHAVHEVKAPSRLAALLGRTVHEKTPEVQYEEHMSKWLMFARWRMSARLGRLERVAQSTRREADKEERVCRSGLSDITAFLEGQWELQQQERRRDKNKAISLPSVSHDAIDMGESAMWTRKPFPVPQAYLKGQYEQLSPDQVGEARVSSKSCCSIQ